MNELHLFAGAGGGILGGLLLGHTPVCAVEIEPYCQRVLRQRQADGILPTFPVFDDVCKFDGRPWRGKVDVICGGFPCQDISAAGKGAGIKGARSGLWREYARIVREVRPRYVFAENSPMLARRGLARVLFDLSVLGYDCAWTILSAADVGAPHLRKRMWVLAVDRDADSEYAGSLGAIRGGLSAEPSGACNDMANADRQRQLQSQGAVGEKLGRISDGGIAGADTSSARHDGGQRRECEAARDGCRREADARGGSRDGRGDNVPDAIGSQREGVGMPVGTQSLGLANGQSNWWASDPADDPSAAESNLGRVAHGVANRVDRLRAIGNGQVPLVAAVAFTKLMEVLNHG